MSTAFCEPTPVGSSSSAPAPIGRTAAEELGYRAEILDAVPYEAVTSFSGVAHLLDLLALRPGEAVLDLGSTTDAFAAALQVGGSGCVVGLAATYADLRRKLRLRSGPGWSHLTFTEGRLERLPTFNASFDAIIANGCVNRSLRMDEVFAEAARVLRPGGRFAVADIVSVRGEPAYIDAIAAHGLVVAALRRDGRRPGGLAVLAVKR
jgi:SAM-dependent methyltransferase